MKSTLAIVRCPVLALAVFVVATAAANPAPDQNPPDKDLIPLIVIDDVPLVDAIRNLARQAGGNHIIDPRVSGVATNVSIRFENVSAREVLDTLLKNHKLTLVANPATTVARIAPVGLGVKPVPASQVGTNAGAVIPLVVMDDVLLTEAITKLAGAAKLKASLDPKWAESADKTRLSVSFRWEKITARQALAALLDNYELVLIEEPAPALITLKPKADPIHIVPAIRQGRPSAIPRDDGSPPVCPVAFAFDDKYELTAVKVVNASEYQTNESAIPHWHLISDSNSIPTKAIVYGIQIRGMKPARLGLSPKPLQPDVPYLLLLEAGRLKGQASFHTIKFKE